MSNATAKGQTEATLALVVTRADGRVEEIGVVAAEFTSKRKQLWWDLIGHRKHDRRIRKINKRFYAREAARIKKEQGHR